MKNNKDEKNLPEQKDENLKAEEQKQSNKEEKQSNKEEKQSNKEEKQNNKEEKQSNQEQKPNNAPEDNGVNNNIKKSPQPTKKTKFSWVKMIFVIVLFLAIAIIVYFQFFYKTKKVTTTEFENRIVLDAKVPYSKKDKDYLKSVKFDAPYLKIYVTEVRNEEEISYVVDAPTSKYLGDLRDAISGYKKTPIIKLNGVDVNVKNAFKDMSKDFDALGISKPGWGSRILSGIFSFLPIIIMIAFFVWMFKKQSGGSGGGIFSAGKNKAVKVKSDKRFSDVAGNEEVKEEIKELVDYLKNPKRYSAAGARIPKGILLGGPPGTGKTLLAKATAGEANVPFYFISGSNFVEMFVGVGASRVRDMFKEARKNSPCIIFIDELDAVGRSRGAGMGGGNDEREQTLNQLLVEMDGVTENAGLLIIAASNRTDVLDPALQRPGRFDRIITVGLPDIKEREAILKLHAKGKRLDPSIKFDNIAKRTPGYSGAQLENVINEASLLSVRERTGVITPDQIDESIDRVMAGPAKKNRVISDAELKMVSIHEAGHAVVGLKIKGADQVQKITIIPRGNAGGYNLMIPEEERYYGKLFELKAQLASFMGGRAAEEIIYGADAISNGAANDIQKATHIARKMVAQWGMSSLGPVEYEEDMGSPFLGRDYQKNKNHSDKVGFEIDKEVRALMAEAKEAAVVIIKKNKKLLSLISETLLEKETIVKEEIDYINKHMKKPPKKEMIVAEVNKSTLHDLIAQTSKRIPKKSKAKETKSKKPKVESKGTDKSKTNK